MNRPAHRPATSHVIASHAIAISAALIFAGILALSPLAPAQVTVTTVHELPKSAKTAKADKPGKTATKPAADTGAPNAGVDAPLLPSVFAGWQSSGASQPLGDPVHADNANAGALKEYGFADGLLASYSRGSETLSIRALRFSDASGAYGAYSFYRPSNWPKVDVGTGGASDRNRVIFWIGNLVIDANFSQISAMTPSELRDLAKSLPVVPGTKALPPPILGNLPQRDMQGQSTHYSLGPAGYTGPAGEAASPAVVPVALVGFDHGAEAIIANYGLTTGPATLTLLSYPTPQIAEAQEKAISDYIQAGNTPQHPWTKPLQDSNPTAVAVRRSGPIVAIVNGDPIKDDAMKLLQSVHYEVEMSAIPGSPTNEIQNYAHLILGIVLLVVIMFGVAVVIGISLGSGRAIFRVMRGKPASVMNDDDFIRLDLRK
jgi:hypothetical protein